MQHFHLKNMWLWIYLKEVSGGQYGCKVIKMCLELLWLLLYSLDIQVYKNCHAWCHRWKIEDKVSTFSRFEGAIQEFRWSNVVSIGNIVLHVKVHVLLQVGTDLQNVIFFKLSKF